MSWNTGAEPKIEGATPGRRPSGRASRCSTRRRTSPPAHPARELAIAASTGRHEEEGWRIRKDGTRFWANVVLTRLQGSEGEGHRSFSKVTRDLTERRLAELSLRDRRGALPPDGRGRPGHPPCSCSIPRGHITSWNVGAEAGSRAGGPARSSAGTSRCSLPPRGREERQARARADGRRARGAPRGLRLARAQGR